MFDFDDPKLAAVAWSRLAKPGDKVAESYVRQLGASESLRLIAVGGLPEWQEKLATIRPEDDVAKAESLGARIILPTDPEWPTKLNDLECPPFVLYILGDAALLSAKSVSLVGARASTHYGEAVTCDIATGLVERGYVIVSGGAYGIDAAAHRAALNADGKTVAVMAADLNRLYPPGNKQLLERIAQEGAVVSELPPGSIPYRTKFLARNRLIAALSDATVVVEAAWRSGALNTANWANQLGRPVGAVPGPVTSMASAGTHQLIRESGAVLVTDAAEVAELAN